MAKEADVSDVEAASGAERSSADAQPGLVTRVLRAPIRLKILVVGCVLLLTLGITGVFNVSNGVDIERQEAIDIAQPHIDFEPTNADARLVRQGIGLRAVWAVSFSIPEEGGGRDDFARLATVELDAKTGEVIRISVDNGEGSG